MVLNFCSFVRQEVADEQADIKGLIKLSKNMSCSAYKLVMRHLRIFII